MRAVQITRIGGPDVREAVDVPEPTPGPGQRLHDVTITDLNVADSPPRLSRQYWRRASRRACDRSPPSPGSSGFRRRATGGWATGRDRTRSARPVIRRPVPAAHDLWDTRRTAMAGECGQDRRDTLLNAQ